MGGAFCNVVTANHTLKFAELEKLLKSFASDYVQICCKSQWRTGHRNVYE